MPDKDNFGAVLQPVTLRESGPGFWMQDEVSGVLRAEGENRPSRPSNVVFAWQNNDLGLKQDSVTAALRSSAGTSGFHEMNHPVVVQQPVAFSQNQREEVREVEIPGALAAEPGTHQQTYIAQPVPYDLFQITAPVNRQNRKPGDPCHTLARDNAAHAAVAFASNLGTHGGDVYDNGVSPTVRTGSGLGIPSPPAVAHALRGEGFDASEDGTGRGTPLVPQAMTVRRLTPRECERLQGFPDDWTLIPWRGKPAEQCPDGPRYKALGNSMAVNVVTWIGERIQAIDAQTRLQPAPTLDNGGGCDVAAPL